MVGKNNYIQALVFSSFSVLSGASVNAEIIPDATLSEPSVVRQITNTRIDGGTIRGSNLFHSFSQFDVSEGQQVYFANPAGVINILTRVTGGQASKILGILGVDGAANLFLINPNGILFGKNATLHVSGSFVATTANAIQFGNQGNFSTTNPSNPPLLTVQPSALLFTQLNNAAITNQASPYLPTRFGGLTVPTGKSLLLVGGNIILDNGGVFAPSGRIEIGGLQGTGSVNITPNFQLSFPTNVVLADVSIKNESRVDGGEGGSINITGQNITVGNGGIIFVTTKDTLAGNINLFAQNLIDFENNSNSNFRAIDSQTVGLLDGGDIKIQARSFVVRDGASMRSLMLGKGRGSNIFINATDSVEVFGAIQGGQPGFGSATQSEGRAGDVIINTNRLSIRDGGVISTSALGGTGRAGDLTVNADTVEVTGTKLTDRPYLSILRTETFASGDAGNMSINARRISVSNSGLISSRAFRNSSGKGGNLNINASEFVEVVGVSANSIFAPSLLTARAESSGDAGNLNINTPRLSIRDGGIVSTEVVQSSGRGGALTVNASQAVEVIGTSIYNINSSQLSTRTTGTGTAGNLFVTTPQLQVLDNAQITASTDSQANGGDIALNIQTLLLNNNGLITARATQPNGTAGNLGVNATIVNLRGQSELSVEATNRGNAGNLVMTTRTLNVTEDSRVSVSSPEGRAGTLDINANFIRLNRGRLTAETGLENQQTGAEINLRDLDILLLRNNSQINASANNRAQGGNIRINTNAIVAVAKEDSDIRANAFEGRGGNIDIRTQGLFGIKPAIFPISQSDITASSLLGVQGQINIAQPDIDATQAIIELPEEVVDATRRVAQICPRNPSDKPLGEFTVTGRGSLPPSPLELMPGTTKLSSLATLDEKNTAKVSNLRLSQPPILEAQGWIKSIDGSIELVTMAPNFTPSRHLVTSTCP
ncbi:haemagglutination activity domain protein [Calothrix sp. PCC 7716]|nr:haemagglutination activity domain protein [Calothrix sp. PCC 7716]